MKTIHNIKIAVGVMCISALLVSCLPETETMGDAGQTLVKLYPGGFKAVAFNAVATAQSAVLFTIRRDVNNEGALNSATTVELTLDQAVLDAYNTANGTTFILLPTTLGTTNPVVTSGKMTITFSQGEFAKEVLINVPNATNFDFSKAYALAFKVSSVTGTGTLSKAVADNVIAQVLVKNKFDGVYEVNANSPMVDVVNSALTGYYPFKYKLITTGANTCDVYEVDNDYPLHPITSAGAWSYYGSFGIMMGFDPAGTGAITSFSNIFGVPANTRAAVLDPSGVNKWDPATKNIIVKYWMKQPSVVPDAPNIRTYFDETWTYKGPR